MSLLSRDRRRFGPCDYMPVWKWEAEEGAITTMFDYVWTTELQAIFGAIYFQYQELN